MIDDLALIRGGDCTLDCGIVVRNPLLSEIEEYGERAYYNMVSTFCATPSDYKSVLYDDFDTDFTTVGEYEFFIMLWNSISNMDVKIILPYLDLKSFIIAVKDGANEVCIYNPQNDLCIDKKAYDEITTYVRKVNGLTKHVDSPGNETTKKYMINKARRSLQSSGDNFSSTLAPLISSMVNNRDFKYDHHTVWDINIYQFMDSVKRIQKIKSVDNLMYGIYSGNVDQKKISKDALNWLGEIQ